ncbi:MAG: HDOD domain-containing protein [Acidobacteriota bacterium]
MAGLLDLNAVIAAASELEPLPASATRLAALAARDDSPLVEIADTVSYDPPLAGRVLRVANSAAFATAAPVGTVRSAIQRLGVGRLVAMAIGPTVCKRFATTTASAGIDEGVLWRHAVATSLAAEAMSRYCTARLPAEAITASLLHDVGKLVLLRFVHGAEREYLKRAWQEGGRRRFDVEREILGCDHAELGGLVARHWGLPETIRVPIAHHHDPDLHADPAIDSVFVANAAAHAAERLEDQTGDALQAHASARDRLGMRPESFSALCQSVNAGLDDVLKRYA